MQLVWERDGNKVPTIICLLGADWRSSSQDSAEICRIASRTGMGFRRGFAPTVLGPIQGIGDQFYDRRIDLVNRHFEPMRPAACFALEKGWKALSQRLEHTPKELFGHVGRAHFVAMGKTAAAARCRAANLGQSFAVELQTIANALRPIECAT